MGILRCRDGIPFAKRERWDSASSTPRAVTKRIEQRREADLEAGRFRDRALQRRCARLMEHVSRRKKGLLLIRLWRRYLFLNVQDQEIYELDPRKVKVQADNNIEWSASDLPSDPIETSEWKVRDVGPMRRVVFRFGKTGNFLDIQLPLQINGKPMY